MNYIDVTKIFMHFPKMHFTQHTLLKIYFKHTFLLIFCYILFAFLILNLYIGNTSLKFPSFVDY